MRYDGANFMLRLIQHRSRDAEGAEGPEARPECGEGDRPDEGAEGDDIDSRNEVFESAHDFVLGCLKTIVLEDNSIQNETTDEECNDVMIMKRHDDDSG